MKIKMRYKEFQREDKKRTLSFLPRKRACIKMLEYSCKSGAKVASFNENNNIYDNYLTIEYK